VVVAYF